MDLIIKVYRAEPLHDDEIKLYISLTNGDEREDKEFVLSVKQYYELGKPSGKISTEQYGQIEEAEELRRAIKKGMGILLYGDNTAAKLRFKLTVHGYSKEAAEDAVEYLRGLGFINEEKIADRIFETCIKKGCGERRIVAEMKRKGVPQELITELFEEKNVDFIELCRSVIKRKWGSLPTEKNARVKAVRSLLSLGYSFDEINSSERKR